jgi:hypothetical protein
VVPDDRAGVEDTGAGLRELLGSTSGGSMLDEAGEAGLTVAPPQSPLGQGATVVVEGPTYTGRSDDLLW